MSTTGASKITAKKSAFHVSGSLGSVILSSRDKFRLRKKREEERIFNEELKRQKEHKEWLRKIETEFGNLKTRFPVGTIVVVSHESVGCVFGVVHEVVSRIAVRVNISGETCLVHVDCLKTVKEFEQ